MGDKIPNNLHDCKMLIANLRHANKLQIEKNKKLKEDTYDKILSLRQDLDSTNRICNKLRDENDALLKYSYAIQALLPLELHTERGCGIRGKGCQKGMLVVSERILEQYKIITGRDNWVRLHRQEKAMILCDGMLHLPKCENECLYLHYLCFDDQVHYKDGWYVSSSNGEVNTIKYRTPFEAVAGWNMHILQKIKLSKAAKRKREPAIDKGGFNVWDKR